MNKSAATIAFAAGLLWAGGAAQAQGMSSDQIIRGLTPGASLSGTGRGIVPTAPPVGEPAATGHAGLPRTGRVARQRSATSAAAQPSAPAVNLSVQFLTNSAELTPAAVRTLNELGRALSSPSLATFHFRIEGHTDTVGSPEANKALSERRAATVVEYLVAKFNVDRTRLESAGMGEDGLLVQTPQQVPEPRNRRVQVINLGA